jgi:hypothetical protein
MEETDNIIRLDTFFVSLDPAAFLRELTLESSIESLTNHKREKSAYAIRKCVDSLLCIKNKKNFKLTIHLKDQFIRLNPWPVVFDIIRPMIQVFEDASACVKMLSIHADPIFLPSIEFDILPALKNPESDCKQQAIRYFDSVSIYPTPLPCKY